MTIDQRICALESQMNRWRIYGTLITLLFIIIITVNAKKSNPEEQKLNDGKYDTVTANKIIIVDSEGKNQMTLNSGVYGGSLQIRNINDVIVTDLTTKRYGGRLVINDNNAKPTITMYQDSLGGVLNVSNNQQRVTADIRNEIDGAVIRLFDTENNTSVDISNSQDGGQVVINSNWTDGGASLSVDDKGHGIHKSYNRKGKGRVH